MEYPNQGSLRHFTVAFLRTKAPSDPIDRTVNTKYDLYEAGILNLESVVSCNIGQFVKISLFQFTTLVAIGKLIIILLNASIFTASLNKQNAKLMLRKRKYKRPFYSIERHILGIFHPEFLLLFLTSKFAFRQFKITANIKASVKISLTIVERVVTWRSEIETNFPMLQPISKLGLLPRTLKLTNCRSQWEITSRLSSG